MGLCQHYLEYISKFIVFLKEEIKFKIQVLFFIIKFSKRIYVLIILTKQFKNNLYSAEQNFLH